MQWKRVAIVGVMLIAACTPGEGPESIPLPTSPDTTTTTSTTTTSTTTTSTTTTLVPPRLEVTIRRTTDGVPHISGPDLASVAYGQGYVSGQDHGCTLLDQILKVYGVRAAALGPGDEGEYVESDFAWRAIDVVGRATADFDAAPGAVVEQFDSFAEGWNAQLADAGDDGLTGWCNGAEWVRPIEPVEVYVYARSVALLASGARFADFIPSAQPPVADPPAFAPPARTPAVPAPEADAEVRPDFSVLEPIDMGSNGWAIGRDRAEGGTGGLLLGNPHFPWEGELRFAEAHLTVGDEIDVYGAQLVGLPGIGIGFSTGTDDPDDGRDGVAWTHTVSAGKRLTAYLLTLDPASPTTYLVDGEPREMTSQEHTVSILRADGTLDEETRTLWSSEYGPIVDFPGLGWTDQNVLTYRDANIDNDEFVEQYLAMIRARSLDELQAAHAEFQGVPLFNTIATDADGTVWYADTSATPNLSVEAEQLLLTKLAEDPITQIAYDNGVVLLDGSDGRFAWEVVPGARDDGLVPFGEMPMVERTDYVFNANDSFWVPSSEFTLDGPFSLLHGEQGIPQSQRTRQNAAVLRPGSTLGLAGDDDAFSGEELRTAAFDNTAHTATLLRQAVVDACTATPVVEVDELLAADGSVALPAEAVDVTAACSVLAAWDGRYDLDRAGPMVWRGVMNRFDDAARTTSGPLLGDAFDPAAPTLTPGLPAGDQSPALQALARSVQTLTKAGFPLDSTLGAAQFTERSGTRIPIHGGTNADGVTNIVQWGGNDSSSEPAPTRGAPVTPDAALRGEGFPVNYGTSFVMAVDFTGDEPQAWTILTYGQTGDRNSPLFDVQMVRFSEKNWRPVLLTDDAIDADPELERLDLVVS